MANGSITGTEHQEKITCPIYRKGEEPTPDETVEGQEPTDEPQEPTDEPQEPTDEPQEPVTEQPKHIYDWEKQAERLPPFDIWDDLI